MTILTLENNYDENHELNVSLIEMGYDTLATSSIFEFRQLLHDNNYEAAIIRLSIEIVQELPSILDKAQNTKLLLILSPGLFKHCQASFEHVDDFIFDPFCPVEIKLRLERQLKPREQNETLPMYVGNLEVNPINKTVLIGDHSVELTKTEFRILEVLAKKPNTVFCAKDFKEQIGDSSATNYYNLIQVHIGSIRKKIKPFQTTCQLKTVKGFGYLIQEI